MHGQYLDYCDDQRDPAPTVSTLRLVEASPTARATIRRTTYPIISQGIEPRAAASGSATGPAL